MPKTDSQIRDRLSEILANITVPPDKRRDYCEYKGKDKKDRYCKITTHKTCRDCRFFSPTMQQRLRVVVEGYDELEEQVENLKKIVSALERKVARYSPLVSKDEFISTKERD